MQMGVLKVTTNNANTINLNYVGESNKNFHGKESVGKLTAHIKAGKYYVKVSDGVNTVDKYIDIKKKEKININLNPTAATVSEPVIDERVVSAAANASQLSFLSDLGVINYINNQNIVSRISSNNYKSALWANASFGIAQDRNNNLFVIENNQASQINVPDNIKASNYSISLSKNKNIYLWNTVDVYIMTGSSFNKVFSSPDKVINGVFASTNNIAVTTSAFNKNDVTTEEKESVDLEVDNTVTLVNNNGTKMAQKDEIELYEANISPDGKLFAFTNDEGTQIYNDKLEQQIILPDTNVNNLVWIDNTRLLYSIEAKIIEYKTDSKESFVLTYAPYYGAISYITGSDYGQYVYFSSEKDESHALNRVSTKNINASDNISKAGLFFPKTFSDPFCNLRLINFNNSTIKITAISTEFIPYCQAKTVEYLTQNNLETSKFNYQSGVVLDD